MHVRRGTRAGPPGRPVPSVTSRARRQRSTGAARVGVALPARRGPLPAAPRRAAARAVTGCAGRAKTSAAGPCSTTAPVVHHEHVVGHPPDRPQVVRHEHHRDPGVVAEPFEQRQHGVLHGGVEGGHRLVEHDHLGVGRQRPGDRQPLPLPAGQRAGGAGPERGVEVDLPQGLRPPGRRAHPCAAVRRRARTRRRGPARRSTVRRTSRRGPARRPTTRWRRGRRSRSGSGTQGSPSSVTVPASGVSSPRSIRASVVLPEPEAPITPSTRPRSSPNDTSSTARTRRSPARGPGPRARPSHRARCALGAAVAGRRMVRSRAVGARLPARCIVRGLHGAISRTGPQDRHRAVARALRRAWTRGHRRAPAARTSARVAGCCGACEHLGDRTLLDDPPLVHDGDPVGPPRDEPQVVRDDEQPGAPRCCAARSCSITVTATPASSAVVGSSATTSAGDPMVAAAMRARCRIPPDSVPASRPSVAMSGSRPDRAQGVAHGVHALGRTHLGVQAEAVGDLAPDRAQRVQRAQGLLADVADPRSRAPAPPPVGERPDVEAGDRERVGADGGAGRGQAEHGSRGDGLAGAGRADQGDALAGVDAQVDVVHDRRAADGDGAARGRRGRRSPQRLLFVGSRGRAR